MYGKQTVRSAHQYRQRGLTLVETMATLAVAAILLTAAVPPMQDFITRNRMSAEVNTFIASTYLARSEAIKRLKNVFLCSSDGSNNWASGWIVFVDNDNSGGFSTGDTILQRNAALPSRFKIEGNQPSFAYDPTGKLFDPGTNGHNTFCDNGNVANTRKVYWSQEGRVRVEQLDSSGCPPPPT